MYKEFLAENQVYGNLTYKQEENDDDDEKNDKAIFWEKIT